MSTKDIFANPLTNSFADNKLSSKYPLARSTPEQKLWRSFFAESSGDRSLFFLLLGSVKDHRHSRWLEEAPLKGAKNLDNLVLLSPVSLGSVYTPGFVSHLILPY
jgi:hypothetical protein